MRVAVLEDDLSQSELVQYWLKLGGHDAQVFGRASELLHALTRQEFDALVLDWNVPDLNGIEVLRHVRQNMNSNIPVLFSTARDSEQAVAVMAETASHSGTRSGPSSGVPLGAGVILVGRVLEEREARKEHHGDLAGGAPSVLVHDEIDHLAVVP